MLRSVQEQAVSTLSEVLLGDQALFEPDNYKGNWEPADLAWVANRCAVLMYMTSGGRSFDQKRAHNLKQFRGWMKHWRRGTALRGTREGRQFAFNYDDVDHVIGLSIVGGRDVGCIYEGDGDDIDVKLCGCATISDAVFSKVAGKSVGIRDLVHLFMAIKGMEERVSEQTVLAYWDEWAGAFAQEARNEFAGMWIDTDDLNEAWQQTRIMFGASKGVSVDAGLYGPFADMCLAEAIWLSVAERSLARQIAAPGEVGHLVLAASRSGDGRTIICLVAAHLGALLRGDASDRLLGKKAFLLTSSLEFGVQSPMRSFALPPDLEANVLLRDLIDLKLQG